MVIAEGWDYEALTVSEFYILVLFELFTINVCYFEI